MMQYQGMWKMLSAVLVAAMIVSAAPVWAQEAAPEAAPEAASPAMVELQLELPQPMFVGTPKNIVSANLEKPSSEKPAPIMMPEGAVNVALDKPVTASDEEPIIGEAELITDGDKEGAEGSFVEFGPELQWVQIDLEAPHAIHAIALWHYHSQARVYHDVVIQVSDDPDFIEGVTTVYNNDHDNSAGLGAGEDKEYIETFQGRAIAVDGVTGRYVRLYSNGSTSAEMNHYIEVEVYATPAG
jgi:hypothetical protein